MCGTMHLPWTMPRWWGTLAGLLLANLLHTQVDLWTYFWASAVGILPMGFVCVYLGTCVALARMNTRCMPSF